jgi:hypothetical protein
VVLARHQHTASPVRAAAHARLGALAAAKCCSLSWRKSSTDGPRSRLEATTSGANSQSHCTTLRPVASGVIRWTITWSDTRLTKHLRLIVIRACSIARVFASYSAWAVLRAKPVAANALTIAASAPTLAAIGAVPVSCTARP